MDRERVERRRDNVFEFCCTTIIGRLYTVFVFVFGVFLCSLIGKMEGKEREREEN